MVVSFIGQFQLASARVRKRLQIVPALAGEARGCSVQSGGSRPAGEAVTNPPPATVRQDETGRTTPVSLMQPKTLPLVHTVLNVRRELGHDVRKFQGS